MCFGCSGKPGVRRHEWHADCWDRTYRSQGAHWPVSMSSQAGALDLSGRWMTLFTLGNQKAVDITR